MRETKQEKTLKMRKFKVSILTNPPVYEIALDWDKPYSDLTTAQQEAIERLLIHHGVGVECIR